MLKKIIFSLILVTMSMSSAFGNYKYIGQFTAGETIEGFGDKNYNGIEYDMVVDQYSLVEFFPQKVGTDSVNYSIKDYNNVGGYFYSSNGTGISSFGSTSYPDGYKIHLMPGTYKVIVGATDNSTAYRMSTTSLVTLNQTPPTQKTIYTTGKVYDPISIVTNTKYYDNIGFHRDNYEDMQNSNNLDFFYFTLTSQSNVTIYAKLLNDFLENNNYKSMTFSIQHKSNTNRYSNSCKDFNVKTEDTSNICTLEAGTYRLKIYPYSYTSGSYNFSINSTNKETTTCTNTQTLINNVCVDNNISTPSTESKDTETIGNIVFLMYEPDGYLSWNEANNWCKSRSYRLPTMNELIDSWNASGGIVSPVGFKKDTFYWASDIDVSGSHKGCAMDYDCSEENAWEDSSYGHPKCVVSVKTTSSNSGGGAFGYMLPIFVLVLLYFRRKL